MAEPAAGPAPDPGPAAPTPATVEPPHPTVPPSEAPDVRVDATAGAFPESTASSLTALPAALEPTSSAAPSTPASPPPAKVRISVPRRSLVAATAEDPQPASPPKAIPVIESAPAAEIVPTEIEPPTAPRSRDSAIPSPEPALNTPIQRLTEALGIIAEPASLNPPDNAPKQPRKDAASKKSRTSTAAVPSRPEIALAHEVDKPGLGQRLLRALRGASETDSPPPARTASGTAHSGTAHVVGRNDPCPCGSGLKFKKCCG